jgi:hypothetical protein
MQEDNSCRKVTYVGDVQGPENVKDTCVKTVRAGTMDRGLTVYISGILCKHTQICTPYVYVRT